MNPALKDFLSFVRSNPNFPELLKAVEQPKISPFRVSEADQSEKARARWIYESGRKYQHELWLNILSGKPTSEGE